MPADPKLVRDLFLAAVRRPVAQWDGYLSEACAGDDDLLLVTDPPAVQTFDTE